MGWLTRATMLALLLLGGAAILRRMRTPDSLIPIAWAALGTFQGIHLLIRFGLGNYSLHAVVFPTVASAFLCAWSWSLANSGRERASRWAALASGAATGFAAFIRIPGVLQIPGLMILLPKRSWPWFLAGGFVAGFLPQALYQHYAAGHWWASTYDTINASAPVLKAVPHYIRFYLLKGLGAPFFLVPAVAFAAYFTLRGWKHWKTLGRAALLSWSLPTAYFLTHVPAVQYYLCPAHLTAVGLLAWGIYFEYREKSAALGQWSVVLRGWKETLALALAPAAAVLALSLPLVWDFVSGARIPMDSPWNESLFSADKIPAELLERKSWIWSDVTNGAFWYYGDKPAFNIAFGGTPELRKKLFAWAAARGDEQFLVMDGDRSVMVKKEIESSGGKLEERGEVFGQKYFKIAAAQPD